MAARLVNLRLNRCDLVDEPANPKARVVLFKRASAPAIGDGHVDRPDWYAKDAQYAMLRASVPFGKPYPNEHAARIKPPGQFDRFARTNDKFGAGISAIFGIHRDGGSELQAIRFDRSKFTPAAARAWLRDHDYSAALVPATDEGKRAMTKKQKPSILSKFLHRLFKEAEAEAEAGPLTEWAEQEEAEEEHAEPGMTKEALAAMKAFHGKLGEAISAYGDGAGLPADHPVHALKALHKEMGDALVAHEAACKEAEARKEAEADFGGGSEPPRSGRGMPPRRKEAEAEAEADAEAEAEGAFPLGPVTKRLVAKHTAALQKRLTTVEKALADERDLRLTGEARATLAKFRGVSVDVEKDAALLKGLRETAPAMHARVLELLAGADAAVTKSDALMREIGSPQGGTAAGTAWAEIEAEAGKLVAKGEKGLTMAKAIDRVMKLRTDLVRRHEAEERQSRAS